MGSWTMENTNTSIAFFIIQYLIIYVSSQQLQANFRQSKV
jgi:hypothetical protein